MFKIFRFGFVFLLINNFIYSQVGIGTAHPDSSAMLQISSKNKGVLLPNIALTSLTDVTTIPSPKDGLIVWNNGLGGLSEAGFYYWNNSKWNMLSVNNGNNGNNGGGSASALWNNSGTNIGNYGGANTNLSIGTSTYDDLVFKVNSAVAGRLGVNNSISFGTSANAGQSGIAIGNSSTAFQGVAIGNGASVSANEASAFGNNAQAKGYQSIALGYNSKTNSNGETALGINSQTNNQNSTAIGSTTIAAGQNSTAIGYGASTYQANAIILGDNNANIGIGTSTPNTSARLDVNGQYKMGEKGSVHKNQISFEVWPDVSIVNLQPGSTTSMNIVIPAALQPLSTRASVVVSPASDFTGNSDFGISNPRMSSPSTITFNLTNVSGSAASLYSGHFYVTINEF